MLLPFLLSFLVLGLVQFSTPHIWGADGYLHAQLGKMVLDNGFLKSLPQLPYSLFSIKFSDKEFLYHLFSAPLNIFFNPQTSIKIFALLNALALFSVFLFILKKRKDLVPLVLILLFGSPAFLFNLSRPRTMILSFALMLLSLFFLGKKKYKPYFFLTIFYTMWHVSGPQLSLIFSSIHIFTLLVFEKKLNLKPLLITLAAIGIGFLLHPNFPDNLFYWYLNGIKVPWFATRWGVLELGAEFFPYSIIEYLVNHPLLIPLNLSIFYIAYKKRKSIKPHHLLFLLANLAFFILSFRSQRYANQSFPLALVTLFLLPWPQILKKNLKLVFIFLPPLLILNTLVSFKLKIVSTNIYNGHFEEISKVIQKEVPKDSTIFHANWSDSQYLLGLAPNYKYIVTLDPIYIYDFDKDLHKKYRSIAHGLSQDPKRELKDYFNSKYVHTDKIYFASFYKQLRESSDFTLIYETRVGALFKAND